MNRPITHPIIRLQVAQLLQRRDQLSAKAAVDAARDLIVMLAAHDIYLVKGNWMETGRPKNDFDFSDIPDLIAEQEEMHPWNPVELQ